MSVANVFKRWPARVLVPAVLATLGVSPAFAVGPNCDPEPQIAPKNQAVNENATVDLNGQPSKDTISYSWAQTAGPTVTLNSTTDAKPTFVAPSVGSAGVTLKFTLTVKGCSPEKTSSPLETTITVLDLAPAPNRPPVAAASVSPATIYTDDIVTLNGSGSSDPEGQSLTFSWVQIAGTPVTLTNANTAVATFTAPLAPFPNGTSLTFKLTVSDGTLTGTTEQIVNVLWQNVAPTAGVSCPAFVDERAPFVLDGSASTDPDDGIAAYAWAQTMGGPIAVLPADLTTISINASAPSLTSPLDVMSFKLDVTDAGGLVDSAECDVIVNDITPPVSVPSQSPAANGAGWNNTDVTVSWNWLDAGKGVDENNCTESSTSSGEGNPLHLTANCTDLAGNLAESSYDLKVDKSAPTISWNGTINDGDSFFWGSVPAQPTCSATDTLSGVDAAGCTVSGYSTEVGMHTLKATASDVAGNKTEVTRTYEVKAWILNGFYQPVDMGGVWNTVKNGSTVPLKFEVFAANELTDVSVIKSFTVKGVACPATGAVADDIELITTGGTSLRYDVSAGQFIQNWQTPKKPGACYSVTMTTSDGSAISANFKLK